MQQKTLSYNVKRRVFCYICLLQINKNVLFRIANFISLICFAYAHFLFHFLTRTILRLRYWLIASVI
jgi:hypothetical protein